MANRGQGPFSFCITIGTCFLPKCSTLFTLYSLSALPPSDAMGRVAPDRSQDLPGCGEAGRAPTPQIRQIQR